jgi:hypothetical protein
MGRGDVAVAEQFLHGPDVVATFEQVRGEGVAEGVAGDALVDSRRPRSLGDGTLDDRLVQVMPALPAVLVTPPPRGRNIQCHRASRAAEGILQAMASGSQVSPTRPPGPGTVARITTAPCSSRTLTTTVA